MSPARRAKSFPEMPRVEPPLSVYLGGVRGGSSESIKGGGLTGRSHAA